MKLHEIIAAIEAGDSVLIEKMIPYKKSLQTYYSDLYCSREIILIVTDVFNAAQYGFITSADRCSEDVDHWIEKMGIEGPGELAAEIETIYFNSGLLASL